jgi:hypothetical protein
MNQHFESYLRIIEEESPGISSSIKKTVNQLIPSYIKTFSFREHTTGLLLGNVQSGKTSQVFGIISSAADEGFAIFVFLTTDNTYLHQQTLGRAISCFDTFTVCGEDDELRFIESKMRKPVIIVIKKNTKVLQKWKNIISSSKFYEGRPLFIIDDEGDTASLNTMINRGNQSAVNAYLEGIRKIAKSSIYLQVTATPQSLLLQSAATEWRPKFIYYFPPGEGYLGGDFFYNDPPPQCIKLTKENELEELRADGIISEGLKASLLTFLTASAHAIQENKFKACNFLVHPSVRIADHNKIADKIGGCLNDLLIAVQEDKMSSLLNDAWKDLSKTKNNLISFDKAYSFIKEALDEQKIKIFVMNSTGSNTVEYSEGINIIVGGNSLGRGVTFPSLQTVYYCRTAKIPQADTFWQHSRMFGYDRDPELMRIFIPPALFKLFTELNSGNSALVGQIIADNNPDNINLLYPPGINPTRMNIVDKGILGMIVGGVNRFPNFPKRKFVKQIDEMLKNYDEDKIYTITLNNVINLLEKFESESKNDWPNEAFVNCIEALKTSGAEDKAFLIIRRNRSISKGTGTLLSPCDRLKGDSIRNYTVLTLYRINGEIEKGWDGNPFWIPNIKLPEGKNFYRAD